MAHFGAYSFGVQCWHKDVGSLNEHSNAEMPLDWLLCSVMCVYPYAVLLELEHDWVLVKEDDTR
jgi:hypothetical protein